MTEIEALNYQEAFVMFNAFSIELSLALMLALAFVIGLLWLFSPGGSNGNR